MRTYNFPENRVTDHRVHVTLHKLDRVLEGELDELTEALAAEERRRALEVVRRLTVRTWLAEATARLAEAGVPTPRSTPSGCSRTRSGSSARTSRSSSTAS